MELQGPGKILIYEGGACLAGAMVVTERPKAKITPQNLKMPFLSLLFQFLIGASHRLNPMGQLERALAISLQDSGQCREGQRMNPRQGAHYLLKLCSLKTFKILDA